MISRKSSICLFQSVLLDEIPDRAEHADDGVELQPPVDLGHVSEAKVDSRQLLTSNPQHGAAQVEATHRELIAQRNEQGPGPAGGLEEGRRDRPTECKDEPLAAVRKLCAGGGSARRTGGRAVDCARIP